MTNKSTPPATLSLTHPAREDVVAFFEAQPRQDYRSVNPPVPPEESQVLSDAFDWLHSLGSHDEVNPLPAMKFFVMVLEDQYPEHSAELRAHVESLFDL